MPGRLVKWSTLTLAALILVALAASLVVRLVGNRSLARARADVEARWGTLDRRSFAPPAIPEDRNAAAWLTAGASAVVWTDDERSTVGRMTNRPPAEWSDEERAVLATLRVRNAEAVATSSRAVALDASSWDIAYEDGFRAKLPGLLEQIQLARLVLVAARSDIAAGDLSPALDGAALLARQAESLQKESVLMLGLVGLAVERMELVVLADLVAAPGVDNALLGRIEGLVLDTDLADAFRRQLRFEIASAEPVLGPELEASNFLRGVQAFGLMPLVVARCTGAVAEWMEVVDTPLGVQAAEPSGVHPSSALDLVGRVAEMYVPDLGDYLTRVQSVLSLRHRMHAAVALRRTALKRGAYPDPGTVAALAAPDPFTGRPLSAVLLDDGRLSLEIPGAGELAADRILASAAATLEPLALPPASAEVGG